MKEVGNRLYLGWDYIVTNLQRAAVEPGRPAREVPTVHDGPEDDNSDDGSADYQEPPKPPANHWPGESLTSDWPLATEWSRLPLKCWTPEH